MSASTLNSISLPVNASKEDTWVLVLGPRGVGKSYLIGLIPGFQRITNQLVGVISPASLHTSRRRFWFIELSLFDEHGVSLALIEAQISFLREIYAQGIEFSAVLWLHRITDIRLRGSSRDHTDILETFVGQNAMPAVTFVTTYWNRQRLDTGSEREQELSKFWSSKFLAHGAQLSRFYPVNEEGALEVIEAAIRPLRRVMLQIQVEVGLQRCSFQHTSVYNRLMGNAWPQRPAYHPIVSGTPAESHRHVTSLARLAFNTTQPFLQPTSLIASCRDKVIAVMGVTGSGKSSFVQHLTDEMVPVSSGLESFTENITIYRCSLPGIPKFFLIDTPGFDDTKRSDLDVLEQLADFLVTIWNSQVKFTGIIYVESIMEVGTGRAPDRHLSMFRQLCGQNAFENVALVTTFWDTIQGDGSADISYAFEAEDKLRNSPEFWAGMIEKGARMFRHRNTKMTATRVVKYLIQKQTQVVLNIQEELISQDKSLPETAAGAIVTEQIFSLQQKHERQLVKIREEIKIALEDRDKQWQAKLEEMKQHHESVIAIQLRHNIPYHDSNYGPSNISDHASAVLGNLYKTEHKNYHIQNATLVFENTGRFNGPSRSCRDSSVDGDQDVRIMLREFLNRDDTSPYHSNSQRSPEDLSQSRDNVLHIRDGYG